MSTASEQWLAQHRQPELNQAEREFRDRFVTEYLIDYSSFQACLRLGFEKAFASDYAMQYMSCQYVQREIKRRELDENVANPSSDEAIRKRIKAALFREAHDLASKPTARIAALKALADIYGMNAPIKQEITATLESNVRFYLPSNGRDASAQPPAVPGQPQEVEAIEEATIVPVAGVTLAFPAREDSQSCS